MHRRVASLLATLAVVLVLAAPAGAYEPPPVPRGAVVFLGDSITRQQPWARQFPGVRTSNQGVGGDQSADVLRRLAPVLAARPRAVFVLIGSNDVHRGVARAVTVARVERILARVAAASPATRLHLGSVLPRRPKHAARIVRLNEALAALAARRGVPFVDTHRHFHDGDGVLRPALTDDGSHLTPSGKALLARILRPHVLAAARG